MKKCLFRSLLFLLFVNIFASLSLSKDLSKNKMNFSYSWGKIAVLSGTTGAKFVVDAIYDQKINKVLHPPRVNNGWIAQYTDDCIDCGACEATCPNDCFSEDGGHFLLDEASSCEGCDLQCLYICPVEAIAKFYSCNLW